MSSQAARRSLTLTVLDVYFDEVVFLRNYLTGILIPPLPEGSADENVDIVLLQEGDSAEYIELLTTSVVGLKSDPAEPLPRFAPVPPLMYMRDVCDFLSIQIAFDDTCHLGHPESA